MEAPSTSGAAAASVRSASDPVLTDGTATLLHFRGKDGTGSNGTGRPAVLLVPSLINRWYVIDLRPGSSLCAALVERGFDVYALDWGAPEEEDRHLGWDDVVARVGRMVRRVRRATGGSPIGLLGYCIGGTLSTISTALAPEHVGALVNLAGPIDFSEAGFLGHMTNPRWFDPESIASAGNMRAEQMQAGFVALRPTSQIAKVVTFLDRLGDPERLAAFQALDGWASDNISFPAAAYHRYIKELYQENRLVRGEHAIAGKRVDLSRITCPLLTVTTTQDAICPPKAALGLEKHVGSSDIQRLSIPGGHVGGVIGDKAKSLLYPRLADFFGKSLEASAAQSSEATCN